jgi:hypothetical protein
MDGGRRQLQKLQEETTSALGETRRHRWGRENIRRVIRKKKGHTRVEEGFIPHAGILEGTAAGSPPLESSPPTCEAPQLALRH